MPATARASVLGDFVATILHKAEAQTNAVSGGGNLQTMALPKPAMNSDPMAGKGGGDITIVDNTALLPDEGPSGTVTEYEKPKSSTINTYIVREGDTLNGIAKMFKVTPNTILWANDISKASSLRVGQKLIILPIDGLKYTVKKGDTLASIAKRTGGDATEISNFNGVDDESLIVGTEILIPNGELSTPAPSTPTPKSKSKIGAEPAHNVGPAGTATQVGYYLRPIVGGLRTQGVHGYNGVDLAAPIGTPILASADGDVIVAKAGGWNGGYGSYVVIQHDNGSQTLYAHMSKVSTDDGAHVTQGEVIGYLGQTGKATGPHVHFEIRDGIRNPF